MSDDVDAIEILGWLAVGVSRCVTGKGDRLDRAASGLTLAIDEFLAAYQEHRAQQATHDRVLGKAVELQRGVNGGAT